MNIDYTTPTTSNNNSVNWMNTLMQRTAFVATLTIFAFQTGIAEGDFTFWPDADYDPDVPSVESVVGHKSGERITWHRDTMRYFDALAEAAPDRIRIFRYAETWEGRELIYAVITSPENMARIDDIKINMQRLIDPRMTSAAEAEEIISSQPMCGGRNGRVSASRAPRWISVAEKPTTSTSLGPLRRASVHRCLG